MTAEAREPELSVLVVSWNTRELLGRCVASVLGALDALDGELIVVDNGSADGSAAMVAERFGHDPRVTLVALAENSGFSRGNNVALERARGRRIFVVNSDLEVDRELLESLGRHLDEHPEAGLVTCRLVDPRGRTQSLHRRFPSLASIFFCRTRWGRRLDRRLLGGAVARRYRPRADAASGWTRIEQAAGALMALRRSTIEEVGGLFDERFPILGSDVDLCRRLRDRGYQVHLRLDRAAVHHGSASLGQVEEPIREDWWWDFVRRYYQLHEPRWKQALLGLVARAR